MSKLSNRAQTRQAIKTARQNTPVCGKHNGKYSYESNLVARICELEDIADAALDKLTKIAASYGFGDSYDEICTLLEKNNEYQVKALHSNTKGCDWGSIPVITRQKTKEKAEIGVGVFGKTWDEIEEMQGGKLNRK